MQLTIDPALDPAAIAKVFRRLGRLHITGFLAVSYVAPYADARRQAVTGWVRY